MVLYLLKEENKVPAAEGPFYKTAHTSRVLHSVVLSLIVKIMKLNIRIPPT